MGYDDERAEEYRLLRAADAAIALILDNGLRDACARFVIVRLIATMVDSCGFGSGDPASTLGAADQAVSDTEDALMRAGSGGDEQRLREQLRRVLRAAADVDIGLHDGDLAEVTALRLDPFARRVRLLMRNMRITGAAVARQTGVPVHQLHHWAAGRSKPDEADRAALARAIGIHPSWLEASRDTAVDISLYRFRQCPCGTGAALRAGPLDDIEGFVGSGTGLWCSGCGQPHLLATDGWFFPVPVTDGSYPCPLIFDAVRTNSGNIGGELDHPWPHALWVRDPDPDQPGGPYRMPAILTTRQLTIRR